MISVDELKQKFGPPLDVAPYGECIVIQGKEFDPDWEALLGDLGYRCHFTDLDGHTVTLVQLKKPVAPGKVVYVPPAAPKIVHVNGEVKQTEKVQSQIEKKVYALKGPTWTGEDEAELLKAYDGLVSEGKKYRSLQVIAGLPRFKGRSIGAIAQHLKKLKKRRAKGEVVADSGVKQKGGNPHPKMPWLKDVAFWSLEEDDLVVALWNKGVSLQEISVEVSKRFPRHVGYYAVVGRVYQLQAKGRIEKRHKPILKAAKAASDSAATNDSSAIKSEKRSRFDILSEAYDNLSKAYVELKTDFLKQQEFIISNMATVGSLNDVRTELRKDFVRHKHAMGSGEAMLPMEGSE